MSQLRKSSKNRYRDTEGIQERIRGIQGILLLLLLPPPPPLPYTFCSFCLTGLFATDYAGLGRVPIDRPKNLCGMLVRDFFIRIRRQLFELSAKFRGIAAILRW